MGTTLAVVQSVGIIPCFSEAWNNSVNVGVSSSASVLSSLVGMWSGPVALCSLSVHRSLWISACCMLYSARRYCGENRRRLMACACRWYDARCRKCRTQPPSGWM